MKVQKIRVTKQFSFDMAHALYGHDGLCKNIHGHTYELQITLLGIPLSDFGNPKDGMVIDFGDLKTVVKREVLDKYDHALVLNADSPHADLRDLKENFEKLILLENQPTCENLVIDITRILSGCLPLGVMLLSVRLRETPTSCCEWHAEDNL
jgi:6-pyruvoyltetrahydropterin/6-carboxytetrahydropterin synthase